MAVFLGLYNNDNQTINISGMQTLGAGETGNSVTMYGGNDTVIGSKFNDIISGGSGNDSLNGIAGNDFLNGENGNDTLLGGTNNDSLYGGAGDDLLNGQSGIDFLVGGAGNDLYVHNLNSGVDRVNDNLTVIGSGGGTDTLLFTGIRFSEIAAARSGNNLILTSIYDTATLADAVLIENYFLGGNYKIEMIGGYDATYTVNFV